jgi:hypothetical protein
MVMSYMHGWVGRKVAAAAAANPPGAPGGSGLLSGRWGGVAGKGVLLGMCEL